MKFRSFFSGLCVLALALLLSGCVSTGTTPKTAPLVTASDVDDIVDLASAGVVLVLQKNPKAVPVLRTASAGIDTVLTENSLTPERVNAFVRLVSKDVNLSPEERFLVQQLVLTVHKRLVRQFGAPDLNIANPAVRAQLERVKKAIDDTLASYSGLTTS